MTDPVTGRFEWTPSEQNCRNGRPLPGKTMALVSLEHITGGHRPPVIVAVAAATLASLSTGVATDVITGVAMGVLSYEHLSFI